MDKTIPGPLDRIDDIELYRMLGEAWYAQFSPDFNELYYLAPSAEIGEREYKSLLPQLRDDLRRRCRDGAVACAISTIQRLGTWRMPATVVAALAIKHGLVQPEPSAA